MTTDTEAALLARLIAEITGLLPPTWESAKLVYRAVGDNEFIQLAGVEEGGGRPGGIKAAELRLPHSPIPDLLRRHREITADPDEGAWSVLTYQLRNSDGETDWSVSAGSAAECIRTEDVTPADCATELQRFPRPEERLPAWMRELLHLHRAAQDHTPVPQAEGDLVALLPAGTERLFVQARAKLADLVPGAGRLGIGEPARDGWSVTHAEGVWFVLAPGGSIQPHAEARRAVAHAMAGIMADADMEINSAVLTLAGILTRQRRPRKNQQAWMLHDIGRELASRTAGSPRPRNSPPCIALDPLHNRPGGYFICFPEPAPQKGSFVTVHDLYVMVADKVLPKPSPSPKPISTPPTAVLPVGTVVDTYGDPADPFVFDIETPFLLRGLWGTPSDHAYHRYRVEKPIQARTGLFEPGPLGADPPPPNTGMGYHLPDSITALLDSGHLVEVSDD
ncbi:glycohydrolase toxin TNT-related protein [Spirillospora albida]|uniref:glycohydrolase toxin TNT-related protein n=1 Tax=Spirillospora albida TaxID=58123 RepID=UPI0004C0724E|nr:glycohydrolase toxin TNT-related protein [Spirillospora albida]